MPKCTADGCDNAMHTKTSGLCNMHLQLLQDECTIEGCALPIKTRGYCDPHYRRWLQYGDPLAGRALKHSLTGAVCHAEGGNCGLPAASKGLCSKHYARLRLTGIVDTIVREMVPSSEVVAFLAGLVDTGGGGCVTWPWRRDEYGYGKTTAVGETLAHRVACRLAHGEPPPDKPLVLHSCGRGHEGCVAPWHLYWGDKVENAIDARGHGTLCIGEKVWNAKLAEADIPLIRRDQRSDYELGLVFGVSPSTIGDVRAGRTWKHVPLV
jgi:hypothetical protein